MMALKVLVAGMLKDVKVFWERLGRYALQLFGIPKKMLLMDGSVEDSTRETRLD